MRTYAFIFVCQEGELEIESLLLAASLKRFLRCEYELIAAVPVPQERWGRPGAATCQAFDALGARMASITNEVDLAYPLANKLGCLKIPTRADTIVFVDSDIVGMRPFDWGDGPVAPFAARPAGLQTFSDDLDIWRLAYEVTGVPMTSRRVRTAVSGVESPPYFNSGFFAIETRQAMPLYEAWIQCCKAIRSAGALREKWHWSEQVGLGLAVQKLGIEPAILDVRYNFPASAFSVDDAATATDADGLPYFCHYHWPEVILRQPLLAMHVRSLAAASPVAPALSDLMRAHSTWQALAPSILPAAPR